MYFFAPEVYQERRSIILNKVKSGKILICGNNDAPMNYRDNIYHFRQDSSFRYLFGIDLPGLYGVIDCDSGISTLFGEEYTIDDIIWIGPQPSLHEMADKAGIKDVQPIKNLQKHLQNSKIHYLPPYRADQTIFLSELLEKPLQLISEQHSMKLIDAIISTRSYKSTEEIIQMEEAVNITRMMHLAAIRNTSVDKFEFEIVAEIHKVLHQHHAELSYPIIFSVNGQTLHNHYHGNKMNSGQLVLNDSGAENIAGYAGDITRTFPVDKTFTSKQKEIYQLVLDMEKTSIEKVAPGVLYRDVHISANQLMLEGLKSLGIVQGNIEDMLHEGVGGLFMPHGLGHMIGMDVHDMENLGENHVGYSKDIERSKQLGLKSLRLAKKLEEGFVLTVEPGIYFIPQLIEKYKAAGIFKEYVNYSKLESYYNFGGIRIEDNILVTKEGRRILGEYIPKEISEIESLR